MKTAAEKFSVKIHIVVSIFLYFCISMENKWTKLTIFLKQKYTLVQINWITSTFFVLALLIKAGNNNLALMCTGIKNCFVKSKCFGLSCNYSIDIMTS